MVVYRETMAKIDEQQPPTDSDAKGACQLELSTNSM